ncbi:N-acetylglucosamine-6-phosphate deacetylase [Salisediminibacterium selenitireducens]|uniref:N-acetylglucosamine-6-phosphate deacetylase n=1 Tax=Bacillus selenitireducens (strain ATCC 700615 / DSM 15326 / MLS10) TaxID=439292 RepID=D6XVV4_BACIE|nr:N-acetylglucosamine-6-phosphate deacetylase [Salisediminibacterium selenitireducens]ADH97727.1 N-acetylglucosamine-6-phosphate deacetylase [[Bacillus] selenitireducens MLS10]
MKNKIYIQGGTVYNADGAPIRQPLITVNSGIIEQITEGGEPPEGADVLRLDGDDVILPGFIDIHIHGSHGADVMDATPEALATISRSITNEGVTSFLATTITAPAASIEEALQQVASSEGTDGARCLGVHLEGPFINAKQAGAQPVGAILDPDAGQFKHWQALSGNQIRIATIAPERPGGAELVQALADSGVIGSIGHSDASSADVRAAEQDGLRHATHLFNGMRGLHHREAGVVGGVMLSDNLKAELILDHVHVSPDAARVAYQALGANRLMLITDAMRGKGLGDGVFDLGGQEVTIEGKEARLKNGALAGSVLTMDEAVRNARSTFNASWHDIARMTSYNQAESLGLTGTKGTIQTGADADLTVMSRTGFIKHTIIGGEKP